MELMRVKVFNDPNYASNTVTNYSLGGSCSVVSVNAGTIYVSATEKDAVTNLKAVVNTTTGDYVTIEEVASL